MFTNKVSPWQWILIIIAVLVAVGSTTLTADASGAEPPSAIFMYNGVAVKYYKTDYITFTNSGLPCYVQTDKPVYFIAFDGKSWDTFSLEDYTVTWDYDTSSGTPSTQTVKVNKTTGYAMIGGSSLFTDFSIGSNPSYLSTSDFEKAFGKYLLSEEFVEPEIEPTIVENTIALTGFKAENGFAFSWTGIKGLENISDVKYEDIKVSISPMYYAPNVGWVDDEFDSPESFYVPYMDYSFIDNIDSYYENCPYDSVYLSFVIAPEYRHESTNTLYIGAYYIVRFDLDGSILDTTLNDLEVPYVYDGSFSFINPNYAVTFDNTDDSILNFVWSDRTFENIDYVFTGIRTEVYCFNSDLNLWEWKEFFPVNAPTLLDGVYKLSYRNLKNFISVTYPGFSFGNGNSFEGSSIRFVPYYHTFTERIYGDGVSFVLTDSGAVKNMNLLVGDVYSGDYDVVDSGKAELSYGSALRDLYEGVIDEVTDGVESTFDINNLTQTFFSLIQGMLSVSGSFATVFKTVFSFMPDFFVTMIIISFSAVVILRIIGR